MSDFKLWFILNRLTGTSYNQAVYHSAGRRGSDSAHDLYKSCGAPQIQTTKYCGLLINTTGCDFMQKLETNFWDFVW